MDISIPTMLTITRIGLIPILVAVYYAPIDSHYMLASFVFCVACVTDWLDGYLARSLKLVSKFGEFLDPVADKLLVVVALILVIDEKNLPYLSIPAMIIIGREITISALREWMSVMGKRASVTVNLVGKTKTTMQMLSLALLLAYSPAQPLWLGIAGYVLIFVSCFLTLCSMIVYLRIAWIELS